MQYPGLYYYIRVSDGVQEVYVPFNYNTTPFSIAVLQNHAPLIAHTPVRAALLGQAVPITATVTDADAGDAVSQVMLYYRSHDPLQTTPYYSVAMSPGTGGLYSAGIPADKVLAAGVDYYISAWDTRGVRADAGTPGQPYFISVGGCRLISTSTDVTPGSYPVVLTVSDGYTTVTQRFTIAVASAAPAITSQPQGGALVAGANFTMCATLSGTAPIRYQWWVNNHTIAGATNACYAITNVQPGNAGSYYVVASNVGGSVTSAVAILTVLAPPSIVTPPPSQTVLAGATVTFNVTASGAAPLNYQWRFNNTNLAGTTSASLVLSAVQPISAGLYSVVVSNVAGSVTSTPAASLTVITYAATQTTDPAYPSPGTLTVACHVSHALDRSLLVLVWEPTLPAGWTLLSASGDGNPQVSGGLIAFNGAMPNPLNFTYSVGVPAGQTGPQPIYGDTLYLLAGMTNTTYAAATPDPLILTHGAVLSLQRQTNTMAVTLHGDTGRPYWILSSTNLVNWKTNWAVTTVGGWVQTNLPMTGSKMFYRAVPQ